MKKKITEQILIDLGFLKTIVSPEDSGTENGFYYYTFGVGNKEPYNTILISCANDETINGGYIVEFFDMDSIKYKDARLLGTLVNIIKLGYGQKKENK